MQTSIAEAAPLPVTGGRFRLLGDARQLKFLAAGLLAVLADYATFSATYVLVGAGLGVATVASYVAGFAVSFSLNKLWVFGTGRDSTGGSVRQVSLYGLLMVLNMAFTYWFVLGAERLLSVDPQLSKIVSIAIVTGWNYVLYSKVIFSSKDA